MPVQKNKPAKPSSIYSKEELDKIAKAKKIIAQRNAVEIAKAKEFAAANPTNPKIPKNLAEAVARSIVGGVADAGSTALGMVGAKESSVAKTFNDIAAKQGELVSQYYPESDNPFAVIGAQALARFPQTFSSIAQDVYSPIQKIKAPATLVAKYPQIASFIEKHGPTALNTLYHAYRGQVNDGAQGALVSGSGNLIGEKVIEPGFLKFIQARFPSASYAAQSAAGVGNVGGMIYEKTLPGLYEYIKSKTESK